MNHRLAYFVGLLAFCGCLGSHLSTLAAKTPEQDTGSANSASAADRADKANAETVEFKRSSAAKLAKGEITFDDLKFDIEPDAPFDREMLHPSVERLVGKNVKLRGFILPGFKATNLDMFILVRDNRECCFGPGAALYDCVIVRMQDGETTDYATRAVTVEGKFKIQEVKDPVTSKHLAVFQIDGTAVK